MKKGFVSTWLIRILMFFISALILVPFGMLILTSTKSNAEFYKGIWYLPQDIISSITYNYSEAWARGSFGSNFMNTVIVAGSALIICLVLSAMVSYVITRRKVRAAGLLSTLFLLGLLIPSMVGLTPQFIMARFAKLFNTRTILVITYTAAGMPFSVFTMTAFFKTIPSSLEEAAAIDGASPWRIFAEIILPLVRPALVSAGIFLFLDYWSEYMRGLMFIVDPTKQTISMGMLAFKMVSGFKIDWGVTCAACIIFIAPVLILYLFFQEQISGGLTAGSVKG